MFRLRITVRKAVATMAVTVAALSVVPAASAASISGTWGNDYLTGTWAADTITGGFGNDIVHGYNGNDTIYGGFGSDILFGDNDNDTIYGGPGQDRLNGGYGDDILFTGTDAYNVWDQVVCGPGYDVAYVRTGDYIPWNHGCEWIRWNVW